MVLGTGCGTIVEWLDYIFGVEHSCRGVINPSAVGPKRLSWRDIVRVACQAADGLAQVGVQAGDRVAIAAENSLEWIVVDWAVQLLGAVLVPLPVPLSADQLAWRLSHSGSRLLIVSGQGTCDCLSQKVELLEENLKLVSFAPAVDPRTAQLTLAWSDVLASGNALAGRARWNATQATVHPSSLASIVYTSGTSGEPRGVMLTQGNLIANARATVASFGRNDDDCRLNVLPFSHAFGRMSDLYVSLLAGTDLALCQSRETVLSDAQQVNPTLMVVVPLLLARIQQATIARFGADDALGVRRLLGGKIRGFICGGAPLATSTREYFAAQGLPIWEGYGLTEASPVVSASSPKAHRPGTVGQLVPDTFARIADDGELLIRGPQVMAGYWREEAATIESLQEGWLHTGDLAKIDQDGFLSLQGRKKEFIALANGRKVWPANVEADLTGDPLIEQIIIVGEGRAALGALVVPRNRPLQANAETTETKAQLLLHLGERLAHRSGYEQVRRLSLLSEPWTVETGELTPKLTLRRAVILARHANCIERMFQEDEGHDEQSTT